MTVPDLGRVGLWTFFLDLQPADRVRDLVPEIEAMGWGCVWVPEAVNRDAMVNSALLLSASTTLNIGTGIASIWGRDPMTTAASLKSLSEAWPGRFVLGLGVSHQPMVDHIRGQDYTKPFTKMRDYLAAMDAALYMSPAPETTHVVLAALGPKMLALSATAADGAHPYFVPVEHTAVAREHLGPDALLAPEQAVVLSTDADEARRVARGHMATYLNLPNYTNNLRRFGWGDEDLADGGSDRLVDAIVAWGDEQAILDRVAAHHERGADHVALQVLPLDGASVPMDDWHRLAQALDLS
ncbi:MAG TPA: LLM class F420-dependent oxidoreductase [Acidimicrobiales bacterium]